MICVAKVFTLQRLLNRLGFAQHSKKLSPDALSDTTPRFEGVGHIHECRQVAVSLGGFQIPRPHEQICLALRGRCIVIATAAQSKDGCTGQGQ